MSIYSRMMSSHIYYTGVKANFSAFVRRNYLGIEVYAKLMR